jgi:hypothetical protein
MPGYEYGPQHAVVYVEGLYVDWTARQFDPQAAVPTITTSGPEQSLGGREEGSWVVLGIDP